MRSRSTWCVATAVAALCFMTVVLAECPNGCSGNGDCMTKDMCNCYKNFQGNDCGDRTCLFGRAHVDTLKGDINMDKSRTTPGWILANSQRAPAQTYEYFNPDAVSDEAHFYMECSNKGICDHATGKCSGHGTCESVRELGRKNGGTLFGLEGSTGAVLYNLWDSNSTYGCRCDPWFFGPDCNKRNCKVGVDPLNLSVGSPRYETFVVHAYAGTAAELAGAYIRLRVFDYHGESFITTKIMIVNDADTTLATATANNLANAQRPRPGPAVAAAIQGVPNLTFKQVKCEPMGAGSDLKFFKSLRPTGKFGLVVTCQYVANPGRMRIPEIAGLAGVTTAFVVTTSVQGQHEDWFTLQSPYVVDSITGPAVTLTAASPDPTPLIGSLIKIGPHIVSVSAKTGGTGSPVTPFGLTLDYALNHVIGSSTPIFTIDPLTAVTIAPGTAVSAALTVGIDVMTVGASPTYGIGDLLFFENAFFYVQEIVDISTPAIAADNTVTAAIAAAPAVTEFSVRLHKPFGGTANTGADSSATMAPFKVTKGAALKPYQYVSECSGRGICGFDTGICACFKGCTNDNCDTQNILAL